MKCSTFDDLRDAPDGERNLGESLRNRPAKKDWNRRTEIKPMCRGRLLTYFLMKLKNQETLNK